MKIKKKFFSWICMGECGKFPSTFGNHQCPSFATCPYYAVDTKPVSGQTFARHHFKSVGTIRNVPKRSFSATTTPLKTPQLSKQSTRVRIALVFITFIRPRGQNKQEPIKRCPLSFASASQFTVL